MSEIKKFHTIIKKLEPYDPQNLNPTRRNSIGRKPDVQISSRLREGVQEAVQLLKREEGYVVAFPTETVYGLGANIFNDRAVKKIFEAKKRPQDNPLIVHISRFDMLSSISTFPMNPQDDQPGDTYPALVRDLIDRFWPGPLTILFPANERVSILIRGSESIKTVAVRMPNHPIALALIDELGSPVCAPSANLSGKPSPTNAQHVYDDLNGIIPFILDGGPTHFGLESTVIDVSSRPATILRPGALSLEQLKQYLPDIQVYSVPLKLSMDINPLNPQSLESSLEISGEENFAPATPGLKYKHYSPNARVILLQPPEISSTSTLSASAPFLENIVLQYLTDKSSPEKRLAVAASSSTKRYLESRLESLLKTVDQSQDYFCQFYDLGANQSQMAQRLFATLRQVDRDKMDVVYVEGVTDQEVGLAVMNRLRKAAGEIIVLT